MPSTPKTTAGRFFEDFKPADVIVHATPRTLTHGDVALYGALYGARFAVQSADSFAQAIGYPESPLDDLLVFHTVFGKTVPDISLNAVANLGYAEGRFHAPVFPGDTLTSVSTVLGVKETSAGDSGIVYVRTIGLNQRAERVLEYVRWVLVRKRDKASPAPAPSVPKLAEALTPDDLKPGLPPLAMRHYDLAQGGSPHLFEDYAPGEVIDHVDGVTLEEAEHQLATRLYQNTARVHFNQLAESKSRFGKRLVYGGVVISMARALSFNGLANAFAVVGLNAGRHVAPCFAGDTIFAASEIVDAKPAPGRTDLGLLRTKLYAVKNRPALAVPLKAADGAYADGVILDLDLWLAIPRRAAT